MIIPFDVFGTVFNMNSIPKTEVRNYVNHVRDSVWKPLKLPVSWRNLEPHPDAAEGIARLREEHTVVTLSNGPVELLVHLSRCAGIEWDMIVPLEMIKVYKPYIKAYDFLPKLFHTNDILMVTANPKFGDIEAANTLGWKSVVIRNGGFPNNILELDQWVRNQKN
jgi:2-haloalkanoic acid dehalogenase type II